MPDDRLEEIKWLAFGGPDFNVGHNRRADAGRMVRADNVRVLRDGSLKSSRDQFRIESKAGVGVLSLCEYKTVNDSQLIQFGEDGGFYYLNGQWPATDSVRWDYGYELFSSRTWSTVTTSGEPSWGELDIYGNLGTNTGGCFALAQYDDYLYILRDSARMLRWDGDYLKPVGLLGPFSPPFVGGAEDFINTSTAWTQVEATSTDYLTVTSSRITAADMPENAASYTYRNMGSEEIADFEYRFTLNLTYPALGAAADMTLLAISTTGPGAKNTWTKYIEVFSTQGTPVAWIGIRDHAGHTKSASCGNGVRYCRLTRTGTKVRLYVATDATMSNETMISLNSPSTKYTYLYAMAGNPATSSGSDLFNGYLENLYLGENQTQAGNLSAGPYQIVTTFVEVDANGVEVWESMPSPPSAAVTIADNEQLTWSGIPIGPTPTYAADSMYRKLYRSFNGGTYQYLTTLEDNTTTTWDDNVDATYLGEGFPYDYATPPWGKDFVMHGDRGFIFRVTHSSESYEQGLYEDPAAPYTSGMQGTVFYSETQKPWYYPVLNQFRVDPGAQDAGMCSWNDMLFIFKANGVWVWKGYDEQTFSLEQLDSVGMCAYRACVPCGRYGVMWAAHKGLMFYDGAKVITLVSYVDGGLTRPQFSDGEKPKMAWANGRAYFLSGDDLCWFEPETATFGRETMGDIGVSGILGVCAGDDQSHVLTTRKWANTTSAASEITVLHTAELFNNFAAEGTMDSVYHAPIDIIFAPLVPDPDEVITAEEIWLDCSWTGNGVAGDAPMIQWSKDKMATWNTLGAAPQGNHKIAFRQTATGAPLYIRLVANYAADFQLYGAKLIINKRQNRGTAQA